MTTTRAPVAAAILALAGVAALLARPPLVRATDHPTGVLVVLFAVLLVAGAAWPIAGRRAARPVPLIVVTAAGATLFALGRLTGDWHGPSSLVTRLVVLNSLAAVAEEAFFRRFVYGLLEPRGAAVAVVGSAALFALVHVTVYGWWVLPLDLAAGLVLSWQRWASGSWAPSAITHVIANVLVLA